MPRLNIQILIDRLEDIEIELCNIWEELLNYELTETLEGQIFKIRTIIKALKTLI